MSTPAPVSAARHIIVNMESTRQKKISRLLQKETAEMFQRELAELTRHYYERGYYRNEKYTL